MTIEIKAVFTSETIRTMELMTNYLFNLHPLVLHIRKMHFYVLFTDIISIDIVFNFSEMVSSSLNGAI